MQSDKYRELAKKLKALADRGEGGEKYNAQGHLQRLMKKYHISMEDIEREKRDWLQFRVGRSVARRLFFSVAKSVAGHDVDNCKASVHYPSKVWLNVTKLEKLEIEAKYDFYFKAYKEQLELFYYTFLRKNRIFHRDREGFRVEDLSPEELEEYRKISKMADTIEEKPFRKALQSG